MVDILTGSYGQKSATGYSSLPFCGQNAFIVAFNDYGKQDCQSSVTSPLYVNCICTKHSSSLNGEVSSLASNGGCGTDDVSSVQSVLNGFCSDNAAAAATITAAGGGGGSATASM